MTGGLEQLREALARNPRPPVVLIAGADDEARHEALRSILDSLDDDQRATGVDRFEGGPLSRVLDAARTASLLGGGRVVVSAAPPGLADSDEKAREQLGAYLQSPTPGTLLVLVTGKLDRRLKIVKTIESIGVTVACERPRERDMPQWIATRAQRLGLRLAPDAIQLLADAVGTDTGTAVRELEKLALVTLADGTGEKGAPLRGRDVEPLLGPHRSVGAFALEDALLTGKPDAALDALERHIEGRDAQAPLALLARLTTIARRLVVAGDALNSGGSETAVQEALGCHPFVAKKYAAAARSGGAGRGERALAACVVADTRLKSGAAPYPALARVVMTLAPMSRSARAQRR